MIDSSPINTSLENFAENMESQNFKEYIMKPQNFEDCNVNYFVHKTFAPIAQLATNKYSPHSCTNNVDRIVVMNTNDKIIFQKNLAAVLVDANHILGDRILTVLRSHNCLIFLPKDIRTLLFTPQICSILYKIEPGEYLHFGVKKCLAQTFEYINFSLIPEILEIDISTDGAKLYKSGKHMIFGQFSVELLIFQNLFQKL